MKNGPWLQAKMEDWPCPVSYTHLDTFRILDETLAEEEYAIAFKKGNTELHDKVMGAFDELLEDGTAAQISEKWFGEDILLRD